MTEDCLNDPKTRDDSRNRNKEKKEPPQVSFLFEHRIADKHQGNVIEIELQSNCSVNDARRPRIERLQDSEPDKNQQREKKWRPKSLDFSLAERLEVRKINHGGQEILAEVHCHVVAEVFPRKVLK